MLTACMQDLLQNEIIRRSITLLPDIAGDVFPVRAGRRPAHRDATATDLETATDPATDLETATDPANASDLARVENNEIELTLRYLCNVRKRRAPAPLSHRISTPLERPFR